MNVSLDSWAVLSWLEGSEPAAARVEDVLQDRPLMSWVNVGEVFYIVHRSAGPERATQVVEHLRAHIFLDEVTPRRVLEAAAIKAVHPMAYADAFALATAQAHGAVLLTGDPEILGAGGDWRVEDLRS